MAQRNGLIKTYAYDPLDRLTEAHTGHLKNEQFFYNHERLITEKEGGVTRSLMHAKNQLLAQTYVDNQSCETTLLSTNRQCSVIHSVSHSEVRRQAFTPFGHHHIQEGVNGLPGFNGERPDPLTGHYHLGKGHRAYNPHLMRFNSPDQLSPFDAGGLNAYAYCAADPVNRSDPSGRASLNDILIAGLGVVGVLGGSLGMYATLKAARAMKTTRLSTAVAAKVAGSALTISGGLVGVTRLSMGAAGEETGKSGMVIATTILALSGLGLSAYGTRLGVMNARRQRKLANIKIGSNSNSNSNISTSSSNPPTVDTPLSATSSGSETASNYSGSNTLASAPSQSQLLNDVIVMQNRKMFEMIPSSKKQITTKSSLVRRDSI